MLSVRLCGRTSTPETQMAVAKKTSKSKQEEKTEKLAEVIFTKLIEQYKFKQPFGSEIKQEDANLMARDAWLLAHTFYEKKSI